MAGNITDTVMKNIHAAGAAVQGVSATRAADTDISSESSSHGILGDLTQLSSTTQLAIVIAALATLVSAVGIASYRYVARRNREEGVAGYQELSYHENEGKVQKARPGEWPTAVEDARVSEDGVDVVWWSKQEIAPKRRGIEDIPKIHV